MASRVLVVMGGADPVGLTPDVLSVLAETGLPLHVTAIVRPEAHEACQAVVDAAAAGMHIDLVPPVEDLPALMAHQDLVVSAAGTSLWELCCLAVPTALVCAVDNQEAGYSRVVAAGAAIGLGRTLAGEGREAAVKQLRAVLENPATRQDLSRQAAHLVDGLGAWRIVRAWEQLAPGAGAGVGPVENLTVRRATMADAETLLRWRNDPATRAASRQKHEVALDQHFGWLEASLQRDDRLLLIASDDEGDVGTVRWDRVEDGEWEVSITVAPERRGRSMSRALLLAGERFLTDSGVAVEALLAGVHEANPASQRLFERSGYLLDAPADDEGFLTYRKTLDA
jgi:RimJ/RimL family protein N-acetyltransferase